MADMKEEDTKNLQRADSNSDVKCAAVAAS